MNQESIFRQFKTENDEVEKIYENDQPFVPYLHNFRLKEYPKDSPPHGKELGSGAYGEVYEFGDKSVVKYGFRPIYEINAEQKESINIMTEYLLTDRFPLREKWLENVLAILHLTGQALIEDIVDKDGKTYHPEEILSPQSSFDVFLPIENIQCRVSKPYEVEIQDEIISIDIGDYVCLDPFYIEYLIGVYLRNRVSTIHFIPTLGFLSLNKDQIYLERANLDFERLLEKTTYTEDELNTYLFIILSHIFILTRLGINHNDLHLGNILLKKYQENEYLHYDILGEHFYFPPPPYIPWIADFGLAQKFTSPKIVNYDFIHGSDERFPGINTKGYYDLFMFLCSLNNYRKLTTLGEKIFVYFFGNNASRVSWAVYNEPYISTGSWSSCHLNPRFLNNITFPLFDIDFFKTYFKEYMIRPVNTTNVRLATIFYDL